MQTDPIRRPITLDRPPGYDDEPPRRVTRIDPARPLDRWQPMGAAPRPMTPCSPSC